jgi:hypothetical protein
VADGGEIGGLNSRAKRANCRTGTTQFQRSAQRQISKLS